MTNIYDFFSATKREIVTRAKNNKGATLTAGALLFASVSCDMSNVALYVSTGEASELLARITTGLFVGAVTSFGAAMTIDSIKERIDNYLLLNRSISNRLDLDTFDESHFAQVKRARS